MGAKNLPSQMFTAGTHGKSTEVVVAAGGDSAGCYHLEFLAALQKFGMPLTTAAGQEGKEAHVFCPEVRPIIPS